MQQAAATRTTILQPGETIPNGVVGHVGTCAAFNDPHAVAEVTPVKPIAGNWRAACFVTSTACIRTSRTPQAGKLCLRPAPCDLRSWRRGVLQTCIGPYPITSR
ncbi:protein of unknown function (plasmid) [Cupriavidus taiwanensis]|nr:protein of unknown function [Cupriavidus taiwanensis]